MTQTNKTSKIAFSSESNAIDNLKNIDDAILKRVLFRTF